jgi:hypothetical protein
MDRGLTGTLISSMRLRYDEFAPNEGASKLRNPKDPRVVDVENAIANRAENVEDVEAKNRAVHMLEARVDRWVKEANEGGRVLGYDARRGQGNVVALLKRPGVEPWDDFTVPTSMREVEPGVRLILENRRLNADEMPSWEMPKKEGNDG